MPFDDPVDTIRIEGWGQRRSSPMMPTQKRRDRSFAMPATPHAGLHDQPAGFYTDPSGHLLIAGSRLHDAQDTPAEVIL